MSRLFKAARRAPTFDAFEREVMAHLVWYEIPTNWTRATLREFYAINARLAI